jgi:NAD(P)-dependent dehydrogenase (short-subunit alcohol dehydrogenase family)
MLLQHVQSTRVGRGSIINVASMLGLIAVTPSIPSPAYVASKHAVLGLTKTDAVYYAEHGIRINAICPGYVATPLLLQHGDTPAMDAEVQKVPMKRLASMDEIGDAIVFLAGPMSSFVVGTGLVVDG